MQLMHASVLYKWRQSCLDPGQGPETESGLGHRLSAINTKSLRGFRNYFNILFI